LRSRKVDWWSLFARSWAIYGLFYGSFAVRLRSIYGLFYGSFAVRLRFVFGASNKAGIGPVCVRGRIGAVFGWWF